MSITFVGAETPYEGVKPLVFFLVGEVYGVYCVSAKNYALISSAYVILFWVLRGARLNVFPFYIYVLLCFFLAGEVYCRYCVAKKKACLYIEPVLLCLKGILDSTSAPCSPSKCLSLCFLSGKVYWHLITVRKENLHF